MNSSISKRVIHVSFKQKKNIEMEKMIYHIDFIHMKYMHIFILMITNVYQYAVLAAIKVNILCHRVFCNGTVLSVEFQLKIDIQV